MSFSLWVCETSHLDLTYERIMNRNNLFSAIKEIGKPRDIENYECAVVSSTSSFLNLQFFFSVVELDELLVC